MFVSSVLFLWSGSRLLILSKAKWHIMHYAKSGTTPVGDKIGSFAFEKRNWSGFFTIFKGLWTGLICSHSKSFRELKNVIKYEFCLYLGGLKIGGPNGAKQF